MGRPSPLGPLGPPWVQGLPGGPLVKSYIGVVTPSRGVWLGMVILPQLGFLQVPVDIAMVAALPVISLS